MGYIHKLIVFGTTKAGKSYISRCCLYKSLAGDKQQCQTLDRSFKFPKMIFLL